MKRLLTGIAFALLLALAPAASASWNITAGTATWIGSGDLAVVQEVRDAVLWERNQRAFFGALAVMAQPLISVTDNGDGTGTITLALPRPQADNWMQEYGVTNGRCELGATAQQLLACVDGAIREDLKATVKRYRQSQVTEVQEPELQ